LRSTTISAVIVRITPIFPFPIPATTLQHINAGILLLKPKPRFDTILRTRPMVMDGFLPQRLAIEAHGNEVANWERAKRETSRPAWREMAAGVGLEEGWRERMR
jgi:hypothetical protein